MKQSKENFDCLSCGLHSCDYENKKFPDSCIAAGRNSNEAAASLKMYLDAPEILKMARAAAEVEGEFYCKLTRVEETIAFAKKIGAQRIGIATCMGLVGEARVFKKILQAHGFQCFGVVCKAGSIDKAEIGISEETKVNKGGFEAMCNPIFQAKILEKRKTDLNVMIGLCVGHDTLFMKYSHAPVTVLLTKDRVLGHNPVAALYTSSSYYKRVFQKTD
jgi:uncharacterized metal-binding protein